MEDRQYAVLQTLITIFLPPLGVFMREGLKVHFWVNLILTLLGYVPGLIHGLYIALRQK